LTHRERRARAAGGDIAEIALRVAIRARAPCPVSRRSGEKWIASEIDPRSRVVQNVVDLALVSQARRALQKTLDSRGLGFFLRADSRVPRLDSRRIAWVVESARRTAREHPRRDPDAFARTRRVVRRELIRRLSEAMVRAGL
jgi:hypothetical protein